MTDSVHIWILVVSILFFGLRGFFKGLFDTIFWLVGLIAGYVISFLYGADFVGFLGKQGLSPMLSMLAGYPLLFIVTMTMTSIIPRMILGLFIDLRGWRVQGAVLGVILGGVVGLIGVWFYGAAQGFLHSDGSSSVASVQPIEQNVNIDLESSRITMPEYAGPPRKQKDFVQQVADKFVGKTVEAGVKAVAGDNPASAAAVSAAVQNPAVFAGGLKSISDSGVIRDLWTDPQVQYYMATDNISGLTSHPMFKQLMKNDAFVLMASSVENSEGVSDQEIAASMAMAWKKVQYIRNDPEVAQLLYDPGMQAALSSGNPASLMANGKVQELIKVISKDRPGMESVDFTQYVGGGYDGFDGSQAYNPDQYQPPPEPLRTNVEIYRWVDKDGVTQYTEAEDIPKDRWPYAEKMGY